MTISPLIVRPLSSPEEYHTYFRLADTAFSSEPSEEDAQRWQRSLRASPRFRPEQLRGAFLGDQLLGGYILHERVLCMGAARISTGCIGAVVTSPDARKQGVATALMQDAIDFASSNHHALLLLDGIPKFYARFGYIDMFDVVAVEVDRSAILAQTPGVYAIRSATVDDAADLIALYNSTFHTYTGSFERSLEFQAYRLSQVRKPPMVALSPGGQIAGYLFQWTGNKTIWGPEIAANNWEALLALLHYHARLFDGDDAPKTLFYLLPQDAPMTQWMIDTFQVPDTSQWRTHDQEWGVRSITYHHRFGGWMGRLIDFHEVMTAILPELQDRWRCSLARWNGEISLTVDGQMCVLHIDGMTIQHAFRPGSTAYRLELTPQALVQSIFGYRQLSRLADISHLPDEARSALSILFPTSHTWLPGSDWF